MVAHSCNSSHCTQETEAFGWLKPGTRGQRGDTVQIDFVTESCMCEAVFLQGIEKGWEQCITGRQEPCFLALILSESDKNDFILVSSTFTP